MTAGELLAQLERDPEFVRRAAERERFHRRASQVTHEAAAPVLAELRAAGFAIQTLADLINTPIDYRSAIPTLLKWLPRIDDPRVKETIVRSLTVVWARPIAAAPLLDEFRRAEPGGSLQWAIGNALNVVADESMFGDIVALIRQRANGRARQMLVLALGRMRQPEAVDVLIDVLPQAEVTGHAVTALGEQRAIRARPLVEACLTHPAAWIRKEARRALRKIDLAAARKGPAHGARRALGETDRV
jgi:HEAT repeat protein